MTHMHTFSDGSACPLCGQPNHCAILAGEDPYSCWCMTARIPQKLKERVPGKLRGKACICQSCLRAYEKESLPEPDKLS